MQIQKSLQDETRTKFAPVAGFTWSGMHSYAIKVKIWKDNLCLLTFFQAPRTMAQPSKPIHLPCVGGSVRDLFTQYGGNGTSIEESITKRRNNRNQIRDGSYAARQEHVEPFIGT